MVDFLQIPLGMCLDARDRDRLGELLHPLMGRSLALEKSLHVSMGLRATFPGQSRDGFSYLVARGKLVLDDLALVNDEAQRIVETFTPSHPLVHTVTGGDA